MSSDKGAVLLLAQRFTDAIQAGDRAAAMAAVDEGRAEYPNTTSLPQGFTWDQCVQLVVKTLGPAPEAVDESAEAVEAEPVDEQSAAPVTAEEPEPVDESAESAERKTLRIVRKPEFGTILQGTSLGDGAAAIIGKRGLGWGWAPRYRHFYLGDRDTTPDMAGVAAAAAALQASGLFDVEVEVTGDEPAGAAPESAPKRMTAPQRKRFEEHVQALKWQLQFSANGVRCGNCPKRLRLDDAVIVTGPDGRPDAMCREDAAGSVEVAAEPVVRRARAATVKPARKASAVKPASRAVKPAGAAGLSGLSDEALFAELARRLGVSVAAAAEPAPAKVARAAKPARVETGPIRSKWAFTDDAHLKRAATEVRQQIYANVTSKFTGGARVETHVYVDKANRTLTVTSILPERAKPLNRALVESELVATVTGVEGIGGRLD